MFSPRSLFGKLAGRRRLALLVALVVAAAVAVPVLANEFNDTGNNAAATLPINKPATIAQGDLMVANIAYKAGAGVSISSPSWTLVAKRTNTSGATNGGLTHAVLTKVAGSSEPTSYTFTFGSSAIGVGGISDYGEMEYESSASSPATDTTQAASSTLTAPQVTTTQANSTVIAAYALDNATAFSAGTFPPSGMTSRYDASRGGGNPRRLAAASVNQAVAGLSGNKVTNTGSNVVYTAQTIALRPRATKLAYTTSAHTGQVNDCLGPITVRTENTAGAVNVSSPTEVGLASNGTGSFFSNNICSNALTTGDRTIASGNNSISVYYKPTARNTGSHQLTASSTGLTSANQAQTVDKDDQTITFATPPVASETYGNNFTITLPTASSSLPVTLNQSNCTRSDTTVTMTSGTNNCVLTASQAGNADYNAATNVAHTVNAVKRNVEVTADPQSKAYGDADPNLTYAITDGTLAFSDAFTGVLSRDAGESVTNSPYAITQGSLALPAADYDLDYVGDDLGITKKELTVDADSKSKTYGQVDPAFTATLSGFAFSETLATSGVTGEAVCSRSPLDEDANTYVDAITCALGDLDAANYSFALGDDTADFTIDKKQLDVDADAASKTYGQVDPDFTATLSGFEFSETLATSGVTGDADCSRSPLDEAADTYVGAITCTLGDLDAGNYSFAVGDAADFTIDKKQLDVDADPASKTYGQVDPAFTATLTGGFEFSDTIAVVSGEADCSRSPLDEDADTYVDAITCTLGDLDADNYSFAVGDAADFTINKKQLDVDADPASKTYGQTDPTFTWTLTGGFEFSDTAAVVSGAADCSRTPLDEDVDGYADAITCLPGGLTAGNYSFATGDSAGFTITKKELTVDADSKSKTYGQVDPAFTATLSGFAFSETLATSGVTGEAVCSRSPLDEDANTYVDAITCALGDLDADNYSFALGDDTADFTIDKKQLDVDADAASKTYGQVDPDFTATLSGFEFSETLATSGVTGDADCSRSPLDEAADTYVGAITCTLGDLDAGNYSFAVGDAADFTINKKQLAINADPASKTYGQADPAFTGTLSGFEFGETLGTSGVTGTADCDRIGSQEDVDTYDDVISCVTGSLTADNYSFATGDAADFTINKKQLAVDADPDSKTYGQVDPDFTATLSGFEFSETLATSGVTGDAVCSRSPLDEDADTYVNAITCTLGDLDAGNYSFALGDDTADFTINKKQLDVDAAPKSKTYGQADPTFTAIITGLEFDDEPGTAFTGNPTCGRSGSDEDAGVYSGVISCTPGDLDAANYSFVAGDAADFTIDPKQVSATFNAENKVYDGDTDATITPGSGDLDESDIEGVDDVTLTEGTLEGTFNNPSAGTGKPVTATGFNLDGADKDNYELSLDPETADITPKPVDGSFVAANKVYDGTTAATVSSRSVDAADVIGSDVVTLTGGTATFNNPDVGTQTATLIGASLGGADAANYSLGTIATDTADITKKSVNGSFTAANKVYDGTAGASVTDRSVSGAASGDSVALSGGTAAFANENVGNGKSVSLSGASLSGSDAGNYSLGSVAGTTANITKKSVSGSFAAADKDFDGTTAATITGRSLAGAIAGDQVALIRGSASFSDPNPGVGKTVSGTGFQIGGPDAGNYALTGVGTTTATIRQRDPVDNTPPTQAELQEAASDLLGGDAKSLGGLDLGDQAFAFAPGGQGNSIPASNQPLSAIGCTTNCSVSAGKTLVLTGEAGASAAATKKLKLKTQKLSLDAGELGVVKLKLSKKQKKAIKKAKKAKLVVKVTVVSGGETVTDKKTYRLTAKKG